MRNVSCLGFSAFLVVGVVTAKAQSKSAEPRVVRYHTTMADVKYVYGVASPVARLMPGDILETNTVDAFGNAIQRSGDTLSLVKGDNPLTGPFYIEGAEPGDTLVVKFLDVQVDSKQGVGAFAPGFGALNKTLYTPMLNPPLPERIWFYPVDTVRNVAKFEAMDSKFSLDIPVSGELLFRP
jgi:amidase